MKRILIIIPYFGIGGTTSSLNAFLENVNPLDLRVDIFARKRRGEYLGKLKNCNILPENIFLSSCLYEGNLIRKLVCSSLHITQYCISKIGLTLYPLTCKRGGGQMKTYEYDAVISYQERLSDFLSYIPAKKRIAWIRCEYERYLNGTNKKKDAGYFKRIDAVIAVSEFAKKSFLKVHPWYKNIITINNFMNIDRVRMLANDNSNVHHEFIKGDFTIVSVGRITPVKQFEKIPLIMNKVKKHTNKDIRWYIIGGTRGYGKLEQQLQNDIKKYGLERELKILPETSNPFVYMREADLFVHTSKSETYSRVVAEAKAVGTPVVVNNYAAAYEFVKNGEEGIIVPIERMPDAIIHTINSPNSYFYFKKKLSEYTWPNKKIMQQTLEII